MLKSNFNSFNKVKSGKAFYKFQTVGLAEEINIVSLIRNLKSTVNENSDVYYVGQPYTFDRESGKIKDVDFTAENIQIDGIVGYSMIKQGDVCDKTDDEIGYITYKAGGSVPLNLSGCFVGENKDKVVVYISINLESSFGYMVYVHLGYSRATMAVNATAKYGTFCAPFAVEIPETVTASKVTGVGANGLLTLTDLSTTIPANTPVVLFAESGLETVEFFGVAEAGTPKEGLLTGVYEPTDITSGYVLQNQSGEVGFYRVDSKITVPANRCYLTAPAGSVKALSFPDGTQTSISAIQANDEKAVMYDLSGRRVSKATKGIYITNGKKVLVK